MARTTTVATWEWLDRPGLEISNLACTSDRIAWEGQAVVALDGDIIKVKYSFLLDAAWQFQHADLECAFGQETARASLTRRQSHWIVNGLQRPDLTPCEDIDFEGTPATNTLPIRRLQWESGQSRVLQMAFIRLPDLSVIPVAQRYTQMPHAHDAEIGATTRYEYVAVDSGFREVIEVDAQGLVLHYPRCWRRVAWAAP
jgi:uncharacterized protein